MSKRILAFMLSLLMILSVCFTTACKDDNEGSKDAASSDAVSAGAESSAEEQKELSAKELLAKSLEKLTEGVEVPSIEIPEGFDFTDLSNLPDFKSTAKIDINKVNIMGTDYTKGNPLSLNVDSLIDLDNLAFELNAGVNYADENPKFSGVLGSDGLYITDFLGIQEGNLFVAVPMEQYINDLKTQFADSGIDMDTVTDAFGAIEEVVAVIKNSINSNIPDESYTKETKDVVINDVEFKNATVVSLTVTGETAEKIATEVINGVFAIEVIANALGEEAETTKQDALDSIDFSDFESVKIDTIISENGDIVGAEFLADTTEDYNFSIRIASANGGLKLKMGYVDGNGAFVTEEDTPYSGTIYMDSTYDEATKAQKLVIGAIEGEKNIEIVKIEGTVDENKCEGVFTLNTSMFAVTEAEAEQDSFVSFNYAIETTENGLTLNIKDINAGGMTLPANVTIAISSDENKVAFKIDFKLNITGMAECDVVFDMAFETTEAEISVPTDATNFDDIPEEDMAKWGDALTTKYPKIAALVTDLIGMMMPDVEDYPMDDDITFDDDYVYDENVYYDDDFYFDEDFSFDEDITFDDSLVA